MENITCCSLNIDILPLSQYFVGPSFIQLQLKVFSGMLLLALFKSASGSGAVTQGPNGRF